MVRYTVVCFLVLFFRGVVLCSGLNKELLRILLVAVVFQCVAQPRPSMPMPKHSSHCVNVSKMQK